MCLGEFFHQGQAQTSTGGFACCLGCRAIELLEYLVSLPVRDAGAVILDLDYGEFPVGFGPHGNRLILGVAGVLDCVVQQVHNDLCHSVSVKSRLLDLAGFDSYRRANIKKGIAANAELNELAIDNQAFFFRAGQKELQEFQQKIAEISRTEGISVTYDLPGRLTLPSRSDQQLVSIASITAKADFTLIATPLLTDFVYLQADLLNDSDTVLLPGQASIFRYGEFVGKSRLPQVTIGETFTAGFGIDSQVRVVRELENKKTRIQGGNRIDTYDYRIALSNYKNTPVELRLLDRLPYTDNASIKIELEKTEPELSTGSKYLRIARKKGILRWDLKLAPNTVEKDATVVKYSFTMEYDRNMQIQPRR